ncbi:hypothetical protein B0T21DRAFT_346504 [Apiosordaria backusii]|uniref:Uncharacterized protein n=1 Tax=Apiosordaria backusii TaxID=314023 RepID=A0AA40EF41_9PEZI|nr:hypothetical protein B0T21DRAFT_346504 [Apiosordaria backusii]
MHTRQKALHSRDHRVAGRPKKRNPDTNEPVPTSLSPSNVATNSFRRKPLSHRARGKTDITSRSVNTGARGSGYNLRQRAKGKDLRPLCGPAEEQQQQHEHKSNSQGGANPNDNSTTQDQRVEETKQAETMPQARIDAATVRENRRRLRESEEMARRKAIAKYKLTNDTEVFRPFLAPFIASGEHKRDLGEWQWDAEVERYWRMNKTTRTKIWEPLWESFV